MELSTWIYFLLTVSVLTVTPGPNVLLCITTSITSNFRLSIYSALGGFTATSIIFTLSFLGLGAIIASSTFIFLTIKYAGALYLIYLGYKAFTSKQTNFDFESVDIKDTNKLHIFTKGFIVGASNPKAIIFFTALFPQFIDTNSSLLIQFVILYSTFAVFELFWLFVYGYYASKSVKFLKQEGKAKLFNKVTGGIFIGAGSYLALSSKN